MKAKCKPLSVKFILSCVMVITLIFTIVYTVLYINAKNIVEKQLGVNAQNVAVSVSLDIMGNIEEYAAFLETRDVDSDYYKKMQTKFQIIKNESNIRFIFTELRIDSKTIEFILDSESVGSFEYSPPGSTGPNDWKRETVYNSGLPAHFKVYNHPQWGKIIAAYAPIFNEKNEMIGIVGVNIDVTELINQLTGLFSIMIITYIVIILVATALLIKFSNKIINLTSRLANSQKTAEQSIVSFNIIKTLLNALDTYLFVSELETDKIIFINDKMKKHFNLADDAVGKLCYEVMNTCMGERCTFCVKLELMKNPENAESMDAQVKINGVYYKKADRIIEWYDGAKVHLQYFIDITELKQAEASLEARLEQLQRMSSLINASPQYISYVNPDGRYIFFNPTACKITGYSAEELMENGAFLLYNDETRKRITEEIIPAISVKGEYEFELPLVRKDGQVRIMSFSSFKVETEKDRYGHIASDITDKKLLETELIEAKEAAETANKAKSEFLSRMSHEIRTPLNAIIGMTSIAQSSKEHNKVKYCIEKIDNASKHLLGVINDILDMSKIEADKFELLFCEFDFNKMIKNILDIINFRIEGKHQTLKLNTSGNVPSYILGDEQRLSQVIINLLSNANKFTPDNGNIKLNINKIDDIDGVCTLQIEVEDNGIGVSPEQQTRLFNSFEQGGSSISRDYGGTGLGLAISKRIVELMGGNIRIESEPGNGSKFIFTIKVKKCSGQFINENQIEESSNEREFSKHTILLAEDVEINSEIISTILEETGVTIIPVSNGLEAVKRFQDNPERYSLILMDINMPEMDGYEATKSIRSFNFEKAKAIPIIAMTADVFKEDIERCIAAGMNDHIGKPVDVEDLFKKLNKYLK